MKYKLQEMLLDIGFLAQGNRYTYHGDVHFCVEFMSYLAHFDSIDFGAHDGSHAVLRLHGNVIGQIWLSHIQNIKIEESGTKGRNNFLVSFKIIEKVKYDERTEGEQLELYELDNQIANYFKGR